MNKKKNILIKRLFSHLEGIALIPTLSTFKQHGIIDHLLQRKKISIESISKKGSIQKGYINVGLNNLASLGALNKKIKLNDVNYTITEYGIDFFKHNHIFLFFEDIKKVLSDFISNDIKREDLDKYLRILSLKLDEILLNLEKLYNENNTLSQRIAHQIEGVIIYPLIIYTSHNPSKSTDNLRMILDSILKKDTSISSNEAYNYFISRAKSYGVTASYQPIFSNLDEIIFNNKNIIEMRDKNNNEVHVNRRLNVWGSGGAHKTYFKKIDNIIIEIFNKSIESQPKGIADMGCGDGMFLKHLYDLILNHTERGRQIEKYPLYLLGADLNQEALDASKSNLIKANIDCRFILSDISNPEKYKLDLLENFNLDIIELLHVRSFLDHNRVYSKSNKNHSTSLIESSCAYAFKGDYLTSKDVMLNLIDHFISWKKYIHKHGLLILELHGLNTNLSLENKCKTPTIAYEATHGYSDQYIVEYEVFLECAKRAGLKQLKDHSKVFPNDKLVTISLNVFK